eukprot:1985915-Pyramimonas_sp.AAC.1
MNIQIDNPRDGETDEAAALSDLLQASATVTGPPGWTLTTSRKSTLLRAPSDSLGPTESGRPGNLQFLTTPS